MHDTHASPSGTCSERRAVVEAELARLSTEPERAASWAVVAGELRGLQRSTLPRDADSARLLDALTRLVDALRTCGRPVGQAALGLVGEGLHDFDQLCTGAPPAASRDDLAGAMELLIRELAAGPDPDTSFDARLQAFARPEPTRPRRRAVALAEAGAMRLEAVWSGLADYVRRQGEALGKRVELVATGGELEVSAPAGEALRPALQQLARNACAHGVETPAARQGAGKPGLAILRLSARRSGDRVMVTLADDGRGVGGGREPDPDDYIVAAGLGAFEPEHPIGVPNHSAAQSPPRAGIDLVRGAVEHAGGQVALSSTPGRGAAFTLTLPCPAAPAPLSHRRLSARPAA